MFQLQRRICLATLFALLFITCFHPVSALSYGPLLTTKRETGSEPQLCCLYDQFSVETSYSQVQYINSTLNVRTGRTKLFYDYTSKRMREDTLSIDGKDMSASIITLQLYELTYVYYIQDGACSCRVRKDKWNPLCVPMSNSALFERGKVIDMETIKMSEKIDNTFSVVSLSKDKSDGRKCWVTGVEYSTFGMETKTDFYNMNENIDFTNFKVPIYCPTYSQCT